MTPLVYFYCPYVSAKTSVITLALALILSIMMVLASVPAMAADDDTAATTGSITIKSPVMGATYTAYRVFDMTMGEGSYSYSIKGDHPLFNTVKAYAEAKAEGQDTPKNGLTLTAVSTTSNPTVYNVTADNDVFDAQAFGQELEKALTGENPVDAGAYKKTPVTVTTADLDEIKIEDLELGYYLILSGYPTSSATAKLTIPAHKDGETDVGEEVLSFTDKSTDAEIEEAADKYVAAVITDEYVAKYITDNQLKEKKEAAGETWTDDDVTSVKTQLQTTTKTDTIAKIKNAIANSLAGSESDINVQTQRLVFVDSTTPDAVIVEKNEIDKWDVPVNPDGYADVEGLPDHGEPDGGKNIVVGYADAPANTEPIYADWVDANIGDSIHYQLRVNAMNYVRDKSYTAEDNLANEDTLENKTKVHHVKEYIIADYQKDCLSFDSTKDKIMVKVVDNAGNTVTIDGVKQEWDYTDWYQKFFIAKDKITVGSGSDDKPAAILDNGGGIAIPWVVSGTTTDKTKIPDKTNITINTVITNKKAVEAATAENPVEPVYRYDYFYSIYDSDMTIVVDYTMTLTDKAKIDGEGNINTSQYALNYVKPSDDSYTPPKPDIPEDRPAADDKRDTDTATVYTYALAIQKVDASVDPKVNLAGAIFAAKGVTVKEMGEGYYKVTAYDPTSATYSTDMKCDANGMLVIEGFDKNAEVVIKETKAPDGYNILTEPVTLKPQPMGGHTTEVITTNTHTEYTDEEKTTVKYSETTKTAEKQYFDKDNKLVAKSVTYTEINGTVTTTYYKVEGTTETTIEKSAFDTIVNGLKEGDAKATKDIVASNVASYAHEVENRKGTELPATGGIGTTIFYVAGSILVLAAAILLITKRRMGAND